MQKNTLWGSIWKNGLLLVYTIFSLFPLFWMFIMTLKDDREMFTTTFFFTPTLENYHRVLLFSDYYKNFRDNLIVSAGAVAISVLVGVPAAYVLARYKFKRKEGLAFQLLSYKFAPEILVVLPLFKIFQSLGLYDTYLGLIWVYQLISLPLLVWVCRGYFEDISEEIEYAAKVDGYGWFQIFWRILIPLVKPGIVAAALLSFIFAWNNFTFPLILAGFQISTVTIAALSFISATTVHFGQMAVAALISVTPSIIFALIIQKHLVRGLSFGAVKG